MTENDATKLLVILAANWPGKDLPDETIRLYTTKLVPYELRAGRQAVEWLVDNAVHFPVWAEVRAALTKYAGPPALTPGPQTADRPPRLVYREWNDELDDFVELPEPRPWDEEIDNPLRRMARQPTGGTR